LSTATDLEGAGWNTRSGYGLVNPVAALEQVGAPGTVADDGSDDVEPGEPADTQAPAIFDVSGERTGSSMVIRWSTDEPSTTGVLFEDHGLFDGDEGLVTQHEMGFTIDRYETYYFTLVSEDAAGNLTEDGVWVMYP
jgi:hypothetical protein